MNNSKCLLFICPNFCLFNISTYIKKANGILNLYAFFGDKYLYMFHNCCHLFNTAKCLRELTLNERMFLSSGTDKNTITNIQIFVEYNLEIVQNITICAGSEIVWALRYILI